MSKVPPENLPPAGTVDEQASVHRLGIRDLRRTALIKNRGGGEQRTEARFELSVERTASPPDDTWAGLLAILDGYGQEISVRDFHDMLFKINGRLGAETSQVVMRFPFSTNVSERVSNTQSRLDYDVSFIGNFDSQGLAVSIRLAVPFHPAGSLSNSTEAGSRLTLTVRIRGLLWIEELIEIVERAAPGVDQRGDSDDDVDVRTHDEQRTLTQLLDRIAGGLRDEHRVAAYRVEIDYPGSGRTHGRYAVIEHDNNGS